MPPTSLRGLGSRALVTICALMMVSKRSRPQAHYSRWRMSSVVMVVRPVLALLITLVASAILRAFMNNTPICVMMPFSLHFVAVQVSGIGCDGAYGSHDDRRWQSTTIGTSTNLLVVGISRDLGMHEFTMFELCCPFRSSVTLVCCFCRSLHPDCSPIARHLWPTRRRACSAPIACGGRRLC